MAPQDLYPEVIASPQNWLDDTWSAVDTGGGAIADPGIGDVGDNAWFSEKSGNVTLTANTATFAGLDMTKGSGYVSTLAMAGFDIDANASISLRGTITGDAGAVIYCGGSVILNPSMTFDTDVAMVMDAGAGSVTISCNSVAIGPLTINAGAADDVTVSSHLTCAAFVLTAGDFRTNTYDFTPASISGAAGNLAFSTSTVVCAAGTIALDNITATIGAGDVTCTELGIGAGGTLTSSASWSLTGDFDLDGGTFDMGTNKLTVDGSYTKTGGTLSNPGTLEMMGTGNLYSDTTNYPDKLLLSSGADVTLITGNSYFLNALDVEAGSQLIMGGRVIRVASAGAAPIHVEGTVTATTGYLEVVTLANYTNSSVINMPGVKLRMRGANFVWTQTGALTCGDLELYGANTGSVLTFTPTTLIAADVQLGTAEAANNGAILNLGAGQHSIASVTMGNDANTGNELNYDTCGITVTGTIDGNSQDTNPMTVTSNGANMHGGTILDVDCTGILHCWGVTASGTNSVDVAHESSLGSGVANVGTNMPMAA